MLAETDVADLSGDDGGVGALLPWFTFTLLAAAVIIGGGFVLRRNRQKGA